MKHEGGATADSQKSASRPEKQAKAAERGTQETSRFGGLSVKLLLLTILFVMLAEVLIYVPSIANFRNNWLKDRLTTAGVAAAVLSETNTIAPRLQEELLKTTGALAISLDMGSRRMLIAMSEMPPEIEFVVDLSEMTPVSSIVDSFRVLIYQGDGAMRAVDAGQMGLVEHVDVVLPISILQEDMLAFSWRILGLSLVISVITASLVYVALRGLFVRPLQQLTQSMDHFAEAPEEANRIIHTSGRKDELGDAEVRLAAMQKALSKALQQKQRLAELGLAVSKINHDLRNLLASAQLFLERLENVPDPTVRRLAPKILATLDRAVTYTQAVMAYGKAQEEEPKRRLLLLHRVGQDIGEVLGLAESSSILFENDVPQNLEVDADPEQIFRVLLNLCRNAVQALDAERDETVIRRITLHAERQDSCVHIAVMDTGPGIPPQIKKALFRAFHSGAKQGGTGLGLAIVAELLKAHGGSIALDENQAGTCFRIRIPDRVNAG